MERKNAWKEYSEEEKKEVFAFAEKYKEFISSCKTERECVKEFEKRAKAAGYVPVEEVIAEGRRLVPGDKVFCNNMGKEIAMFQIGTQPMENGMNILGAHIDSPRLDIKQNPLYEDTDMALLDTHYYGGIKKYQWVALPLAIHGVVVKKDGTKMEIAVGEKDEDPVFGVSDILIHLAQTQMAKKASEAVDGEDLNVMVGSMPLAGEEKEAVKANVLAVLKEAYGMEEEDFLSAELEVVPAGKARDYGFDRSLIMGYGQDDRSCAFPSFDAMLEVKAPARTSVCLLVDKEEIGSVGATGMTSQFFENMTAEVMNACGQYSELALRRALAHSCVLSSDVSAAFDSNYPDVFEKKNTAYLGRGIVFNKFTGSRGKSGSNDANAEYLGHLRSILDEKNVHFQTAELGKVDQGGGGTIAYILAKYDMQVVDSGVAVMNMHAPWEIISKADLYEARKCYVTFLEDADYGICR